MSATAPKLETPQSAINRWFIPLGAVAVHICIGSVYAWSTLNRPMQQLFQNVEWFNPTYATYSTALVFLGLSAAFGGPWVEKHGPRAAALASAIFFGSGLVIGGLGMMWSQALMVFLGMGVIGGIGCGLGYIAPVSTLVKWFPDRRGMATGMAIMGFGGGAFVAGKLNVALIERMGVASTVFTLGFVYFAVMLVGAMILRRPPQGWKPSGWNPPVDAGAVTSTRRGGLTRNEALRTPQFYLLWAVLFINVTAGIGILAQASPMVQDLFGKSALEAGTIVSIISLFNAGGRFVWASSSDYIGRRNTYTLFFVAQVALFLAIPKFAASGQWGLFLAALFVVISMYGGGFATIPAFLADMFGTDYVGAIHGAVLTAWSAAAVVGPYIMTKLSQAATAALADSSNPLSRVHMYDFPLQILAGLLAIGFVLTLLIRPLKKEGA
jgi:MFS family permease